MFKCDDDIHVVPERLVDLATGGMPFVGNSAMAPQGYAQGGAVASFRAWQSPPWPPLLSPTRRGRLDFTVLRQREFPLTPTPRLRPGREDLPDPANDIVTAHYCGSELMGVLQVDGRSAYSDDADQDSEVMAITIPRDADHRRSEATLS